MAAAQSKVSRFVTGLVDLRRGRLLDSSMARAGSAVTGWFAGRDVGWPSAVVQLASGWREGHSGPAAAGR